MAKKQTGRGRPGVGKNAAPRKAPPLPPPRPANRRTNTAAVAGPAGKAKAAPPPKRKQLSARRSSSVSASPVAKEVEQEQSDAEPAMPDFPIVGVGASAGGLEAFTQLLAGLPSDPPVAFALVQHLAPDQESSLAELLGAHAQLPVIRATNGMRLEPGKVYVMPPGVQMGIGGNGRLTLERRPEGRAAFMPVDAFFRSLAGYARTRAMAVVLSGSAHDGAAGLKEVEAAGGITFAQDPRTAGSDGMPRAAIAGGLVDFILPPREIAAEILRIAEHPLLRSQRVEARRRGGHGAGAEGDARRSRAGATGNGSGEGGEPEDDGAAVASEAQLQRIFALLRTGTGVDFTHYKLPTIRRRLHRRLVLHKVPDVQQYLRFLQENPAELHDLYDDILINVTRFFREPESFDVLARRALPQVLTERGDDQPVRIWVPGCSTGEEPYSVAMLLLEHLGARAREVPIQIFATDISEAAIDQARSAVYPEGIAADVTPERLLRFFTKVDGSWRVNKSVRDACVFARQDLTRDPPFSKLDLVVCRNVLIYLGPVLQKKLMQVFHYALRPTGFLMLGGAESIGEHTDLFAVVDKRYRLYGKRSSGVGSEMADPRYDRDAAERIGGTGAFGGGAPGGVAAAAGVGAAAAAARAGVPSREDLRRQGGSNLQGAVTRTLLDRYTPPGVLVDVDFQIVQFHGQTGPYLEPAPGEASLNLLKMAREGMLLPLRAALHESRRGEVPVRKTGVRVRGDGDAASRELSIEVIPLTVSGQRRHHLVLFDERRVAGGTAAAAASFGAGPTRGGGAAKGKRGGKRGKATARREANRLAQLEQELAANREYLQSIIQDLEAANEELQSANEEILSSNEELQSTNEELDTAREELQSTNEELNTVNEELQARNEDLSRVNSDLVNLLGSVEIAIVIVSLDRRIRRFTPPAERLLNLIPSDVGRPIDDINPNVDIQDLEGLIAEAIDRESVQERAVADRSGREYSLRVRPYKNVDDKIDGAVVTLVDVSEGARRRDVELRAGEVSARQVTLDSVESALGLAGTPMVLLDREFRVLAGNDSFASRTGRSIADLRARPLTELGEPWSGSEVRRLLTRVLSDGDSHEASVELRGARGGGNGGGGDGGGGDGGGGGPDPKEDRPTRVTARRVNEGVGKDIIIAVALGDVPSGGA